MEINRSRAAEWVHSYSASEYGKVPQFDLDGKGLRDAATKASSLKGNRLARTLLARNDVVQLISDSARSGIMFPRHPCATDADDGRENKQALHYSA